MKLKLATFFWLVRCSADRHRLTNISLRLCAVANGLDVYLQYINMFELSAERYQYNLKHTKAFRNLCEFNGRQ